MYADVERPTPQVARTSRFPVTDTTAATVPSSVTVAGGATTAISDSPVPSVPKSASLTGLHRASVLCVGSQSVQNDVRPSSKCFRIGFSGAPVAQLDRASPSSSLLKNLVFKAFGFEFQTIAVL